MTLADTTTMKPADIAGGAPLQSQPHSPPPAARGDCGPCHHRARFDPASLAEFLQEKSGRFSATRLAFLAWIFGILIVWCIVSVERGALQDVSEHLTTLVGILMTGKVVQRFVEKP